MPIPTEGLGEKRWRASQAKEQAAKSVAATAAALDATLKPDPVVDTDPEFDKEFADLLAAEGSKDPINIDDPHNAAPTTARTTVVNGQKVIDMGTVKITATADKIEAQIMREPPPVPEWLKKPIPERPEPPSPVRVLSDRTRAEMEAGRVNLARLRAQAVGEVPREPFPEPKRVESKRVANDRPVLRSREEVWLAAGLTAEEMDVLRQTTILQGGGRLDFPRTAPAPLVPLPDAPNPPPDLPEPFPMF